ncbi:MAG TPA: SurA N-terminal domain-containing protein [Terriglobales bacterium]|nr:SurA N-terminal domain-containing protein [Terriglobales bacterium]
MRTGSKQVLVWLALAAVLALAGCRSKETGADVMAKVNGKKITREEVDKYYKNQTSGSNQQLTGEQATILRLNILKGLIEDEIMLQRAQKLGLLATDEEVDSKLAEIKAPFTAEEFDKRLKERAITVDDFKRELRRSLTVDKVLNKEIKSKISISDADVNKYYNEHKAEFNLIEPQYHLAQITVGNQPEAGGENKSINEADLRKKVQTILNRLESGEDFGSVAMRYSDDPNTSGNGGDVGFVPESTIGRDQQAKELLGKLKAGQISGPLPLYDQAHKVVAFRIIKLVAKEPAGQRDLSDPRVQQAIREQLRGRREQLLKAAYYEMVRDEAKVENYYADEIVKSAGK